MNTKVKKFNNNKYLKIFIILFAAGINLLISLLMGYWSYSWLPIQASEAALRQAEDDILNSLPTRLTAFDEPLIATPWLWDGTNPTRLGVGNAGPDVSAQPIYHIARLADVCPIEPGQPCFERYMTTARAQGGSAEAVTVLQSTVLLPPQ